MYGFARLWKDVESWTNLVNIVNFCQKYCYIVNSDKIICLKDVPGFVFEGQKNRFLGATILKRLVGSSEWMNLMELPGVTLNYLYYLELP